MNPLRWWTGRRAIPVRAIHFLGEHDGQPERNLKLALARLFDQLPRISRAYLAIAHYEGDASPRVVLALVDAGEGPQAIADAVATTFAQLFNTSQLLDIVFLRTDQETQLRTVCQPFFSRPHDESYRAG